jgi:hypothetical protein
MLSPTSKTSTMAPPASIPPEESKSAAKKKERQVQEGWLKMICQEIERKQAEAEARYGITNKRGVINDKVPVNSALA